MSEKKLGRKSVLVNAERYEILVDRKLKSAFVKSAQDNFRGPAELLRRFMQVFVADPLKVQKSMLHLKAVDADKIEHK